MFAPPEKAYPVQSKKPSYSPGDDYSKRRDVRSGNICSELAELPDQHIQGLMYRTEIAEDEGMLFTFIGEKKRSFWMKNTFVDLSIGFFDKDRKLLQVLDMDGVKSEMETSPPRYVSRDPARYALEVKKGWFKRNKIKLGTRFKLFKKKPKSEKH